jgi:hypothetical protein
VCVCADGQTGRTFMTELGEQFMAFSFIDNEKNLSARKPSKTHDWDN